MTTTIYPGPGSEEYRSARFTVAVQDAAGDVSDCYVYGFTESCLIDSDVWDSGDSAEESFVVFDTSDTVTVRVGLVTGSVTSAVIFPKAKAYSHSIVDGELHVQVPPRSKFHVEVNGDRSNLLCVFADTLAPAVDLDIATTFVSLEANTKALSGQTLYFGPGVWDIGLLYQVESGASVYIAGGAIVRGTFDIRETTEVYITGRGILSGELFDYATVLALGDWDQQVEYSAILGYDTRPGADNFSFAGNFVTGITIVRTGWAGIVDGACYVRDVKIINPWHPNAAGVWVSGDISNAGRTSVDHCFFFCGDTTLNYEGNEWDNAASDNVLVNTSSGSINLGFFGWAPYPTRTTTISQTWITRYSRLNPVDHDYSHVISCFVDQDVTRPTFGRFNVVIDGVWVEGDSCDKSKLFSIGVQDYEWDVTWWGDQIGNIANCTLSNIHIEKKPINRSTLRGTSSDNTAHDISFWNVWIAGVRLTSANWTTYVDQDATAYNIDRETPIVIDPGTVDPPVEEPTTPAVDPVVTQEDPMALTVEDGTIVANADSYISLADATAYHNDYGSPVEWSAATTSQRESALRQATAYLDDFYKWKGVRSTIDQSLHWPRYGVIDTDNYQIAATTIPVGLKRATAVAALKILQGIDLMPDETGNGSTQSSNISVGPITISESYGQSRTSTSTSFTQISRLLRGLIVTTGGTAELSRA